MYHTVDIEYVGVIPVVKFKIGNWDCHGIIDTGAEISFFDKKLQLSKDADDEISLSTVGSKTSIPAAKVKGEILFHTKQGNFSCAATGYSTDLSRPSSHFQNLHGFAHRIDAIFGADFLIKHKCKVDLRNGYLWIQDKTK